jgi:hypothetical protein
MDKKISELNVATALTGTEELPIVQDGETKKVTAKAISELGGAVSIGQVAFGTAAGVIGGDAGLFWDNVNKRLGVGTSAPTARLDVRAQGALSTDIGFRVRNSANTLDLFEVNGLGTATIQGSLFVARSYLNTSDLQIVASGGISGINVRTNSSGRFSIITNYSGGNYTSFLVGTGTNNPTTELICFDHTNSRIGIGTGIASSALVHIKAGSAAVGSAPLKLTAGTNLATPENGAFEFDGTNLYFTVGGVRKIVTLT